MIAFVPVIAAFGIAWELKHHEEPVTGWLLGSGAKPLPLLPGEKPRTCCGFARSRSAKSVKKAANAEAEATAAAGSSSESTLVPPPSPPAPVKSSWTDCLKGRSKPDTTAKDTSVTTPTEMETTDASTTTATSPLTDEKKSENPTAVVVAEKEETKGETARSEGGQSSSFPLPVERAYLGGAGHETIGHTGVHKVVIHREVKEVSVDVDERW